MNKIINVNNLKSFCFLNDDKINGTPKGLIIDFRGLGGCSMIYEFDTTDFDKENILFLIPYLNPWNWMNDAAILEIEEIIEVVKEKYQIKDLKIASTGGSMGGMCALTYAAYAKHIPDIVVANCPVCDLEYHYTERPDLPRTLYSAYYDPKSDKTLEEMMALHSPIKLAANGKLPNTKYVIFHCEKDSAVNINKHTRELLKVMEGKYDITFYPVPDRDHCDLDPEARAKHNQILVDLFK